MMHVRARRVTAGTSLARTLCMAAQRPEPAARPVRSILPASLPEDGEEHFTGIVCPDCAGVLVIRTHRSLVTFVCRIGHVYSPTELLAAKEEILEGRLWTAYSALDELAVLLDDIGRHGLAEGHSAARRRGVIARDQAARLRAIIESDRPLIPEGIEEHSRS